MSLTQFQKSKSYDELAEKCCEGEKKSYHIASVVRVQGKKAYEEHGSGC